MNLRNLVALATLALAVVLVLMTFGGSKTKAALATCSVPSGSYPTIQSAVDDPGCSTVNVAPGVYNEYVAIARALTLNGPNAGISGAGARGSEATVSQVNITANDVIVDGFTFANPGIQMNIFGATTLSGISVKNNIFSGYGSVGFPTYNAGNLSVRRNLFRNPLAATEAMQIKAASFSPGGCSGTVVSDNVFMAASNNGAADINFSCTGSGSTGVTVSGNMDTGLALDTSFTAFSGVVGGIVVTNNNVTGTATAGSAIFFFGGVTGSVDISNNVITDFGGNGIDVGNFGDGNNTGAFTFTYNNLSNNFRSIRLRAAFDSGATVTANRNNVSGNSTTIGIQNDSTTLLANATCNWWGAADGPGPVGPGSGDKVSTGVTFAPWLVSSNLNGPCIGGNVPTNKDQCKNDGWMTRVRSDGSTFKNQGDCIQYVNTGK